jgi:hypothetical protein
MGSGGDGGGGGIGGGGDRGAGGGGADPPATYALPTPLQVTAHCWRPGGAIIELSNTRFMKTDCIYSSAGPVPLRVGR